MFEYLCIGCAGVSSVVGENEGPEIGSAGIACVGLDLKPSLEGDSDLAHLEGLVPCMLNNSMSN